MPVRSSESFGKAIGGWQLLHASSVPPEASEVATGDVKSTAGEAGDFDRASHEMKKIRAGLEGDILSGIAKAHEFTLRLVIGEKGVEPCDVLECGVCGPRGLLL